MVDGFICELCLAKPLTRRYYECSLYWIADCATCGVPMVVFKEHHERIDSWIINEAIKVCKSMFDMDSYTLDFTTRKIHGHAHFHLRPKKTQTVEVPEVLVERVKSKPKKKK